MKPRFLLSLFIAVVCVGATQLPGHAQKAMDDDARKVIGTWRGGWDSAPALDMELVITADKMTGKNMKTGESLGEGTYKLDPAKKTLDSTGTLGTRKGTTATGIYSLDGDTLKWCVIDRSRDGRRPTDFKLEPSRHQFLMTLRRQK